MAIRIPSAQYGPRLPDVRGWVLIPSEEESAGREMTLAFLVCVATDLAAEDVHTFGHLWGLLASLPARCTLVINVSPRFAALFPFWDCPAYPPLSLLNPPSKPPSMSSRTTLPLSTSPPCCPSPAHAPTD
ncbi:hypothetical protein B0H13DRAFT_2309364 [Mycena leptocephala]|nr:hypothetical protein B0H13DRAFT_2309364 [Mycena leptocephala]